MTFLRQSHDCMEGFQSLFIIFLFIFLGIFLAKLIFKFQHIVASWVFLLRNCKLMWLLWFLSKLWGELTLLLPVQTHNMGEGTWNERKLRKFYFRSTFILQTPTLVLFIVHRKVKIPPVFNICCYYSRMCKKMKTVRNRKFVLFIHLQTRGLKLKTFTMTLWNFMLWFHSYLDSLQIICMPWSPHFRPKKRGHSEMKIFLRDDLQKKSAWWMTSYKKVGWCWVKFIFSNSLKE